MIPSPPAPSICILTGNHLCHNPRALKEALAFSEAGYNVTVLGAWTDARLKERDRALMASLPFEFRPVVDFTACPLARLARGLKSRAGQAAHQLMGYESSWQIGASSGSLERAARSTSADLYIAHSESAMVVADRLLGEGRRVGVDLEDWFSEDLLPEARSGRPIKLLRRLEGDLLRHGAYRTCTSRAMAEALAREYDCETPAVIYNAFAWSDRSTIDGQSMDRVNHNVPSVHWYSQTLGFGRGLEDLLAALPLLQHEAEIHLRGKPATGFKQWLATNLCKEWRERVFVHDLVPSDKLLSRIAEHDVGFAGEQKYCRSRDLTVTNKILHYLLGGLAVVASDTAGQREVAELAKGAVLLYPAADAKALAGQLDTLLSDSARLAGARAAALTAAQRTFCWERQVPNLIAAAKAGLSSD